MFEVQKVLSWPGKKNPRKDPGFVLVVLNCIENTVQSAGGQNQAL